MFPVFLDPFSFTALLVVYVIGFATMTIAAGYIAPRIARNVAKTYSLQASMIILGLIIVLAGLSGIGIVAYLLADVMGAEIASGFIGLIIIGILLMNTVSYLLSPILINIQFGARHDSKLQEIVNDLAHRLNMKPPKAMIVKGPPNAFAYGNFLAGKYVGVAASLVNIATPDELKAIIGHELGHHKHRDNTIMLFMGILPSVLYFLGIILVRTGLIYGYIRSLTSRRREGGGGLFLVLIGIVAVIISFLVQVLVLAFSRLREYYADSTGAYTTSSRYMQRALARIHLYYSSNDIAMQTISNSKLKALFIYAFMEAYANPFYHYTSPPLDPRNVNIDRIVDELKRREVSDISEFFSTHPPIPKRLRFLDTVYYSVRE